MKISCVQMDMRLGDVEYNFAHAQDLVRLAVDRDGPDVVVLPETWNTGFFPKDLNPCADRDGERTKLVFSSLARELDGASPRAVGGAVGRNPISIIIPCHRVVGADSSLTGYAGGLERKRWLLEWEGAHIRTPQRSQRNHD